MLEASLDSGEAEAIALAIELAADLILLDEKEGRAAAGSAGLKVTGVLGVLLRAKLDGLIQAVKPEVDALRTRAHFFVSHRLEQQIIEIAGE
jgi:predicted nucleic acid-binding protein